MAAGTGSSGGEGGAGDARNAIGPADSRTATGGGSVAASRRGKATTGRSGSPVGSSPAGAPAASVEGAFVIPSNTAGSAIVAVKPLAGDAAR